MTASSSRNHGGRQVDGGIGTLDALPGVVAAAKGKIPVMLDSGVRCGADIFKALALGATAVGIGRPYVYGLAACRRSGRASGNGIPAGRAGSHHGAQWLRAILRKLGPELLTLRTELYDASVNLC